MTIAIPDTQSIIGSLSYGYARCSYALTLRAPQLPSDERAAIAAACATYGTLANIGDIFILAHMAKETNWFSSERWTKSFNPGGLGSTNDGQWGATFKNPAEGIAAMVAHELLYAALPERMTLPQAMLTTLDPRRDALEKAHGFGCATRWIDLSQRWGVVAAGQPIPPILDPSAYGMSIVIRARAIAALPVLGGA